MSKFINEIEATLFSSKLRSRPSEFDLLEVTQDINQDNFSSAYYIQKEYRIGVRYETRTWLGEQEIEAGALEHLKKRMVEQMKDVIYGDLRKLVYNLERHLYERELYKAFDDIRDIYNEIK